MASSSGGKNNQKRKLWEESPVTFTEFGALSSELRPSGGFFSRLWPKRNKEDSSQSLTSSTSTLNEDPGQERPIVNLSDNSTVLSSGSGATDMTPPSSAAISRHSSRASIIVDGDTISTASAPAGKLDQSEEVLEASVHSSRIQHRTLSNVLNRLGSILDHRSTTPQTYKDSDFKQYWMPDSSCRECYDCGDKFTTFRRRHHCRICGQIFCSKCCNQELPGKIIGYKGGIRVCTYCCRVVQRYAQQSASTGDYRALEDLRAISQLYNESGSFDFGHRSISPRLSLGMEDLTSQMRGESVPDLPGLTAPDHTTPFDLTPQSEFSSQESLLLESKLLIQDSVQLRELWRQICDAEAGVETQTLRIRLRTHQNCIVGKELVDWLIKKDKTATRDQAVAIGQALLYAGYLDPVGNQLPVFKDDFTLYRPGDTASSLDILGEPEAMPTITEEMEKNEPQWFQDIGKASDEGQDSPAVDDPHLNMVESEGQKSNSSESETRTLFYLSEASQSGSFSEVPKAVTLMSRDMVEEPLPRQDSSVHGLGDDFLKGALFVGKPPVPSSDVVTCPHGWRTVDLLREENGEKLAYERLKKAHHELWHVLTRQLLGQHSLLLSWESVISSCITQVSHFVRPDVRLEGDDMDIRNYVHIKKVPGGIKGDTALFHGVIFTKNIAHKKMKTRIPNPLILLLRGTIEFQRVENKFSSLEPQILQEREFMKNCVMKMVAYRPNVVVVEKSVSRLAQEYLLEAGITLLYNVKPSVMERLARFTQADIVPSIDGLVSKPNMGFCHDFRVQTYALPNKETKTLAFFDGCATHLGCTIVLSGGALSELRRVKHILKFMTYTAYNSLLELCYCMDEFAMPPAGADEIGQPFEGLESSMEKSQEKRDNRDAMNEDMNFDDELDESGISGGVKFQIEGDSEMSDYEVVEYKNSFGSSSDPKKDGAMDTVDNSLQEKTGISDKSSQEKGERSASVVDTCNDDGQRKRADSAKKNQVEKTEVAGESSMQQDDDVRKSPRAGGESEDTPRNSDTVEMKVENPEAVTTSTVKTDNQSSNSEFALPYENHFQDESDIKGMNNTAGTVSSLANITGPVAMDYLSAVPPLGPPNGNPQKERLRHSSALSVASTGYTGDNISGRSTPDVFRGDMGDEMWDETPRVIGNIMCVIPKSALPVGVGAPSETQQDTATEGKVIGHRSKSASDVPDDANITSNDQTEPVDSTSANGKPDQNQTQDSNIPPKDTENANFQRPPSKSFREDSLSSSSSSSSAFNIPKKMERCGSMINTSRPSTSKLTELTDFSDPLLGYQNTQDESIFSSKNTHKMSLTEIKQTKYKIFRKALDGVHLSVSPYHKYTVPYIETDKGSRCAVRKFLPDDIFWSSLFDGETGQRHSKLKMMDNEAATKYASKNNIQILEAHPLITCKLTEPIWANNTQSKLADFRARGGRIQVTVDIGGKSAIADPGYKKGDDYSGVDSTTSGPLWEKKVDCLEPTNHQKLMVLFSSYSHKSVNHPYPCVYPWVVTMEFYGKNDITLGGFLERFCFRPQYACPSPTCDTPMTDHVRRFVHGTACINVLLKKLDNEVPGAKENILMWSWCRKCKQVTPVVPISSDTWSLSFAKYLDLRFHSSSFLRRASAEPCPHSLHHDHFQYFGHRNIVASFKFAYISLKELALPASTVILQPPTFDPLVLSNSVKNITYKAMERYSLVLESTMKIKQELTSESSIRTITEFLADQQTDKKGFRDAATNIQMKIQELIHSVATAATSGHSDWDMTFHLYAIFDNIEVLKRKICDDVTKWNQRMQEFMVHQQKKSRAQTSNKKERDSANLIGDELEKSWKGGSERGNKTIVIPPPSSLSATVQSSPPQQPQPQAASSTTAIETTSKAPPPSVNSVNQDVDDTSKGTNNSQTQENCQPVSNAGGTTATTTAAAAATSTVSTTSTAASSTVSIPTVHVTEPSSTTLSSLGSTGPSYSAPTSDGPGMEDATDGWFQDLKGATRRWLSASTFTPIALPFEPCEHHTLPMCERVPIVVYDHEPSSIIAYALSSSDYLCHLREIQTAARPSSTDPNSMSINSGKQTGKLGESVSIFTATTEAVVETGRKAGGGVLSFLRGGVGSGGGGSRDPSPQQTAQSTHHTVDAVRYIPGSDWGDSGGNPDDGDTIIMSDDASPSPDDKPKVGSATPSPHIELQFSDATAKFYCRVYFADQFRKLRKLIFPGSDNLFIRSLSRCKAWDAKGGKSGSAFCKTDDDRFILKQMSNMEVDSFEKFGPQYFQYIKTCMAEQQPTALAKILGVFRIGFRNTQTNHALRQDVLVMENLFYSRKISQKFDLKGSMRNRLVNTASKRAEEELVLLDENLLKCSVESPLYMRPHSKYVLKSAITSDSTFLSTNLVMDYSLLVGVDEDTQELVVGIIDYIRTFTWDKKLEMVVKSSGILGGQGKMPTVVSPQLYRGRFLEAMDRYFLHVPDRWMGLGRDSPSRLTKVDTSDSKDSKKS